MVAGKTMPLTRFLCESRIANARLDWSEGQNRAALAWMLTVPLLSCTAIISAPRKKATSALVFSPAMRASMNSV